MTQPMTDEKQHTPQVQSPVLRGILIVCGFIALVLGIIGVILPIMPTAPFVLIAAACFARSSNRFYNWLAYNKYFGHMVRQFREEKRIPRKTKIWATFLIVVSVGTSIVLFIPLLIADIIVAVIVLGVISWIWSYRD